jgi:hypothetical protein
LGQAAREREEHAGDSEGGEREGELQEDAEKERRLGHSLVRKGASREKALRQLLEGEAKRRQENDEEEKATRGRPQGAGSTDEARRAHESDQKAEGDNEGGEGEVRMPALGNVRAARVRVR